MNTRPNERCQSPAALPSEQGTSCRLAGTLPSSQGHDLAFDCLICANLALTVLYAQSGLDCLVWWIENEHWSYF